jgi:PAS domain S-box-containing protein
LGFEAGNVWRATGGVLRCVASWQSSGLDAERFQALSHQLVFRSGLGLPGRVYESRRATWLSDVTIDPNFPRAAAAAAAGIHCAVAVPVEAGGKVTAVAEFFSRDVRETDHALLGFMAALGPQIGEFVESAEALEALEASEARKTAMLESALDCVISIDHDGRVTEFNPAAQRTFGYSEEEAIGRELATLIVPPSLRERHRAALRRYSETGEATIIGQRLELTGMRKDQSEFPVELAISRVGERWPPMFTGYIRDITERRRGEQEREDLLRLEQFARLDAAQARDQLEAILGGVADGITAQAPDGSLVFANDAAVRTLGYGSREELLDAPVSEVMGRFEVLDERGEPYPAERLPGRRALTGEQAEELLRFRVRATGEERWSRVKASPILDEGGDVAMAINVIEDVTDSKRAELDQQFLSESSRLLGASLDAELTLQRIATLSVPGIADWCAVDLKAVNGSIERVALAHRDPSQVERARRLQERYPPDPHAPTGVPRVLRTGESELYPEIPAELLERAAVDAEHLELLRELGLRSAMVVPMVARGSTLGALTFVTAEEGRRFDDKDLALAEEIGRRCGAALENARLYSERSYIAKTLQESLLPSELPSIPGLETAARFHATGEGAEVGGDFYDLFQTAPGGWTVVVGDVCGKGPEAATITALARYTLRAAAMRERLPSASLRLLNEALLRQREDPRFCTVAYAYVEPGADGARIGFASAGHPLPLLVRADGETAWFGSHGTLLGVVAEPELKDCSDRLGPGDAIVFYTDGVTEARGPGGLLGEERLKTLVASCAGLDADAIAARVEAAALELQDGPPRDDMAVVVLRARG